MASEEMGLVSARRLDNELNSHTHPQLVFHDRSFSCGPPPPPPRVSSVTGDPDPKTTRELTGYVDKYDNHHHHHHHYFHHQPQSSDFLRQIFIDDRRDDGRDWNTKSHGDGSEDDDVEDDENDNYNDDEKEVEGIVTLENSNNNNNSDEVNSNSSSKIGREKTKSFSKFGVKEGNIGQSRNEGIVDLRNEVTIASVDMYYNQYLQGPEGSNAGQKEMGFENGCGFSGRKEGHYSSESGESLRTILSDPITGELMDDAMILPCGHSFGSGGVQHVIRMKACYICSQAVPEDSTSPNLCLRAAIQAFSREEESKFNPSLKRRERYDQDRGTFGDSALSDHLRRRGIQFPFVVTDRVIIKGNKRTPQHFVGREAVVTTQCLNGWYVVKTLDNAESVKLQYRSLAKVSDKLPIQPISSRVKSSRMVMTLSS